MNPNPTTTNCFMYAFDCVHELGGYLCIGMSARDKDGHPWPWQHLGNYDNLRHEFKSFVPPGDLPRHWNSFFGFEGSVVVGDSEFRRPMPVGLMYRGVFALFIALTVWYIKRRWDHFRKVRAI
ncbi:hypothetical protein [Rhodoferax fermentans]|uniref:Uncharacterized protein n=1 Tax=Rhodoferax fermentans TaxID=28066 RepID=A0A1T1ANY7_RHOFE|nr:hypothetical protein [Rhodoferax fermentans]OOV05757.1 hypothetical protein RF819_02695 [Rhodoferax fermentans]